MHAMEPAAVLIAEGGQRVMEMGEEDSAEDPDAARKCVCCDMYLNGLRQWKHHCRGKKHLRCIRQGEEDVAILNAACPVVLREGWPLDLAHSSVLARRKLGGRETGKKEEAQPFLFGKKEEAQPFLFAKKKPRQRPRPSFVPSILFSIPEESESSDEEEWV